jgi:hypothetical protein
MDISSVTTLTLAAAVFALLDSVEFVELFADVRPHAPSKMPTTMSIPLKHITIRILLFIPLISIPP